jgi:integrase
MPYKDKHHKNKWRGEIVRQGQRKTQLFGMKGEAKAWEVEQRALPLEEYLNETRTVYSLAEWAARYLDHSRVKFCSKTYDEKRLAFRELFKSVKPVQEPSKLHPGMILSHFDGQVEKRSGNAANKDRKNLIAAWNWGKRYLPGWPKENPFSETEKQPCKEHPRYIPPVYDFWKVFDLTMRQDRVMLLAYLHTAARRAELFELTWDDVDFAGYRIRLWTRKRKGGREFDWVTMTTELGLALRQWHKDRTFKESKHVFLCEDVKPFCREDYGRPFQYRQHWLPRLCERAGVPRFGIHAIRHLSASILDDKGYPIAAIQSLLRHKSANTTSRYLHKLRGMRTALDTAFTRSQLPGSLDESAGLPSPAVREGEAQVRERPKLRLINFR